jgi:hypothetical protein
MAPVTLAVSKPSLRLPSVKSSVPSFAVMMLTSDDCSRHWRLRRFRLSSGLDDRRIDAFVILYGHLLF